MRRDLAYWRALDLRVKRRVGEWLDRPFPGAPRVGTDWWMARQVSLALAPPFFLAPVITTILYPWLPQPSAWLYVATSLMLLGVAFVAHTEYKKACDAALVVSETPGAGGLDR